MYHTELTFVPSDRLIEELMGRFDEGVFYGIKRTPGAKKFKRRFKGDHHTCLGICHDLQDFIMHDLTKNEEVTDPLDI